MMVPLDAVIRTVAGLSFLASVLQLYLLRAAVRRSLLLTQMNFLALANAASFGWRAFVPAFERTCGFVDAVYKYLIVVSILTDIEITIGTLAVVRHWSCAKLAFNWRVYSLLLTLPVAGLLLIPSFISEPVWMPSMTYCKESPNQQKNQFLIGAVGLTVTFIIYFFAIFSAWLNSPRSVAVHYFHLGIGLFLSVLVCYVPFLIEMGVDVFDPRLGAQSDQVSPLYKVGHISVASTGLFSTLLYGILRMRCCTSEQKGIGEAFAVTYGQDEILVISGNRSGDSTATVVSADQMSLPTVQQGGPLLPEHKEVDPIQLLQDDRESWESGHVPPGPSELESSVASV